MREIQINGFYVRVVITYDQNVKDGFEALEEAKREIAAEILREKARGKNGR